MHILVLNDADDYALGASYARAFRRLGHKVELVDPAAELGGNFLWRSRITRRLFEQRIITSFNRNWISELSQTSAEVVWVGKGDWATPWLWEELKRRRPDIRLVCYNADNPITTFSRGANRPWVTESIPCFDLYCTYNQSLIEPLRRAGAKQVAWIPFAWDPDLHPQSLPSDDERNHYSCDVLFVGNGDSHREKWMKDIIKCATRFNWRFAIYGDWSRCREKSVLKLVRDKQIYGVEMVKAICSAKVSLNILRKQNEGSHNMRTFEIPGCGGLLVSQRSPEQEKFFPNNRAAAYYSNARECVDTLQLLLKNEPHRLQMVRNSQDIASRHTYIHRADRLLNCLHRQVLC